MATIPRYDEPRVNQNGLPGQRQQISAPADAFGAQNARNLESLGEVANKVSDHAAREFVRARNDANLAVVNSTLAETDKEIDDLHRDLEERRSEFVGTNPKAGRPLAVEYEQRAADIYAKRSAAITDPEQRRLLVPKLQERMARTVSAASDLEHRAAKEFLATTGEATLRAGGDELLRAGGDVAAADSALKRISEGVRLIGSGKGLSEEQIAINDREVRGKLIAGTIANYLESNRSTDAAVLFGKYSGEDGPFTEEQRQKIKRELQIGTAKSAAYNIVAESLSSGADVTAALARVKGEGEDQDLQRKIIVQRYAEEAHAKNISQNAFDDQAVALANSGKSWSHLKSKMNPRTVSALQNSTDARARGEKVRTDWETYSDVRNALANDPNYNIFQHADSIGDTEMKELIKYKQELLDPKKSSNAADLNSRIKSTATIARLSKQEAALYTASVTKEIAAAREEGELTKKDEQAIIERNLLRVKGAFGGMLTGSPVYQLPGGFDENANNIAVDREHPVYKRIVAEQPIGKQLSEDAVTRLFLEEMLAVPGVPDSEEEDIKAVLRERGIAVTKQNIRDLYRARLNLERSSK